jgi:hypothetical protein
MKHMNSNSIDYSNAIYKKNKKYINGIYNPNKRIKKVLKFTFAVWLGFEKMIKNPN